MSSKPYLFARFLCLFALMGASFESMAASTPTVSITANPVFVTIGEQSRITWSSTNATQCIGTGNWSGVKPLHDSKNTARATVNLTFTLTCSGAGGSASRTATVTVIGGGTGSTAAPTVTISATPTTVASGGRTTIAWSSTNATACTGSGAWTGAKTLSGAKSTGALTTDLTFALLCTGSGGTASQSATVTVAAAAATGSATLSWSAPTTNTNGTPVAVLSGYHLYYGKLSTALTSSVAVAGAAATTYTITGLTAGTWYFAVAADTVSGTESAQSAVGSKTI